MKEDNGFWVSLTGVAGEDAAIADAPKQNETAKCKRCGSDRLVKFGRLKGVQRWLCKGCGYKFADNKAFPGMKIPAAQIAWALCLYYEGISFKEICQYMQRTYNSYPSDSTVYGWIERFTKMALEAARGNTPRVSDKWIALLTPTRIGDENVWFWDILDTGSRFMLSSHISPEITREDARAALAEAVQKAGKLPAALLSDRSDAFGKSLQFTFNGRRCRVTVTQALEAAEAQLLEQYRSTFKARTVIMKRFKSSESARNVIAAWPLHYNYFRPHEITTHTTPAYQAGIVTPLKIRVR